MFFDARTDPEERTNLIADASRRPEIERLAAVLLASMQSTGDPQTAAFRSALAKWRSGVRTQQTTESCAAYPILI